MGYALLKKKAHILFEEASWITHIQSAEEYHKALQLMDELIEDYDYNKALIGVLSMSIESWENEDKTFKAFNRVVDRLDPGISLLKILMDQYNLGVSDFPEIGSKSLVSKILNHKRRLTTDHIQVLSKRFGISPSLFFTGEIGD